MECREFGVGVKSYTFSSLTPFTEYVITVAAKNAQGYGPAGSGVQKQTLEGSEYASDNPCDWCECARGDPCERCACASGDLCERYVCASSDPCERYVCASGDLCEGCACVRCDPCERCACASGDPCEGCVCARHDLCDVSSFLQPHLHQPWCQLSLRKTPLVV